MQQSISIYLSLSPFQSGVFGVCFCLCEGTGERNNTTCQCACLQSSFECMLCSNACYFGYICMCIRIGHWQFRRILCERVYEGNFCGHITSTRQRRQALDDLQQSMNSHRRTQSSYTSLAHCMLINLKHYYAYSHFRACHSNTNPIQSGLKFIAFKCKLKRISFSLC